MPSADFSLILFYAPSYSQFVGYARIIGESESLSADIRVIAELFQSAVISCRLIGFFFLNFNFFIYKNSDLLYNKTRKGVDSMQ